jgi:hypothetical protein
MSKAIFLSEQYLKDNSPLNPNVSSRVIYFTTWTTQEEKIKPVLGTALYKRLLEGITTTDDDSKLTTQEKELLDEYIIPALMFFVLAELPQELTYKTSNKGLTTKGASAEGSDIPSMSEIATIISRYSSKGESRLAALIEFLEDKARQGGPYAEYLSVGTGFSDKAPNRKAYKCPINLTPKRDLNSGNYSGRRYNDGRNDGNITIN